MNVLISLYLQRNSYFTTHFVSKISLHYDNGNFILMKVKCLNRVIQYLKSIHPFIWSNYASK